MKRGKSKNRGITATKELESKVLIEVNHEE
jgi:hypothetical protein